MLRPRAAARFLPSLLKDNAPTAEVVFVALCDARIPGVCLTALTRTTSADLATIANRWPSAEIVNWLVLPDLVAMTAFLTPVAGSHLHNVPSEPHDINCLPFAIKTRPKIRRVWPKHDRR